MKRATIIVKGDVQRVGYRDMVQDIARECAITGFVRNVHPYDVVIVAEGEEHVLKTFIDAIRIQKPPVFVEELNVSNGEPTGEYDHMKIIRGDWQEELLEGWDCFNRLLELWNETLERGLEWYKQYSRFGYFQGKNHIEEKYL